MRLWKGRTDEVWGGVPLTRKRGGAADDNGRRAPLTRLWGSATGKLWIAIGQARRAFHWRSGARRNLDRDHDALVVAVASPGGTTFSGGEELGRTRCFTCVHVRYPAPRQPLSCALHSGWTYRLSSPAVTARPVRGRQSRCPAGPPVSSDLWWFLSLISFSTCPCGPSPGAAVGVCMYAMARARGYTTRWRNWGRGGRRRGCAVAPPSQCTPS